MNFCNMMMITFYLYAFMNICSSVKRKKPHPIADKIERITTGKRENQKYSPVRPPLPSSRSPLFDSLLSIPIQTLRAVNDLVQSIAGNLQTAGNLRRPIQVPKQKLSKTKQGSRRK
ncbi:CLUMA_CG015383, isoform A [Clunio marinus]|uniref:CLUMA_CG015383, isoform A n=1 Tax=Clunio marinus TaxID=568069 RepID=A0A1J1IPH9_9DIPT|nr:CLUMA_CG015383, isoform A [Clunio marinus]